MARLPRLTVPGYLHHVLQRGNNRQAIFLSIADYQFFLALLHENALKFLVAVHAYGLLGNEFHLLATPATQDGLPLLMQAISRRYVRYFNTTHSRSGTLWEGRYRSTLLEAEAYLLPCMAAIDFAPVAAGLAVAAKDYPWTSYSYYVGARIDKLITPHPLFWKLGNTPFSREAAYAELVRSGVSAELQQKIVEAALAGWALGGQNFMAELQKFTERRLQKVTAGRPTSKLSVL